MKYVSPLIVIILSNSLWGLQTVEFPWSQTSCPTHARAGPGPVPGAGTSYGCWEALNCCHVSRRHLFHCLSFKHVQAIWFSSVTTFLKIFICFSFWKKNPSEKPWRVCEAGSEDCVRSYWQENFHRFQVFPLTTPPRLLRRWDFFLYRSCSRTWVGRSSFDFIYSVYNPPCLLSCTNCWLQNPQGEGQDKKTFSGIWKDGINKARRMWI